MGISKLGVVGGGTMGTGIAQSAVTHGVDTVLVDVDHPASIRGRDIVAGHIDGAAARGRLSPADASAALARLTAAGDPGALADDQGRFLGMHYFVPAGVNKLVEVVDGAATAPATVEAAAEFVRTTGKQPLVCGDSNGFVVNRFFIPYFNEAVRIYEDGVAPAQIDEIARETFHAAVGPFFVMNLSKTRICLDSCRTLVRFGEATSIVRRNCRPARFDRRRPISAMFSGCSSGSTSTR